MKKVLLIEDRYPRQKLFMDESRIDLDSYSDALDNYTHGKEKELLELALNERFDFAQYSYIIAHKSAFNENNAKFLTLLREYAKEHDKILILFSGGISINYYDNNEYEVLELNSQTFYSANLKLFLDATREDNENILMLCYGEDWKRNVVANAIENINTLLREHKSNDPIPFSKFSSLISKLDAIDYHFKKIEKSSRIEQEKIERFRDGLLDYLNQLTPTKSPSTPKKLLIHNNNTDIKLFENRIRFELEGGDIDSYISNNLLEDIKSKEFDVLFIKDNLSSNYLELYGLIIAHHIRLSLKLKEKRYIPIVIISDLDSATLNALSPLARILHSDGVYIIKNSKEAIEKFNSITLQPLTTYQYQNSFLNRIEVQAPENSTNHDIANEWAIDRWAEFLKVQTQAVKQNRDKIASMLYFKYLVAEYPIEQSTTLRFIPKKPTTQGKVLYIDDEWHKGWSDIFEAFFANSSVGFNTFEYDFKDKDESQIMQSITQSITNTLPDVVVLDLRLLQNDKNQSKIEALSGIKVAQTIKSINAGIQIIMLSASSQNRVLEKLYEYDIVGYIKKAHPQEQHTSPKESFKKLSDLLNEGLEKKYLKEIWSMQEDILELEILQSSNENYKKIKDEIDTVFEILNSNLENKMKFTILTIYKTLEILIEEYPTDKKGTYEKFVSLFKKFNITNYNNDISQLVCTRNFLAHAGDFRASCKNSVVKKPNQDNILTWFKMLQTILEKIDAQPNP
ncbi:MAG: hypothetical protein KU38_04980 [Sulfurovum sp. FS08-3]|nr:MAG: hypothetical protein KU38_04980 [Sulfurovum sp. FS08-3]